MKNTKNKNNYFIDTNNLNNKQKKYCRCVLHVMKNNTKKCNADRKWETKTKCYNPYATCAKSIGTTTGSKSCNYNINNIPYDELEQYLSYNKIKFNLFLKKKKIKLHTLNKAELVKHAELWYMSK